MEFVETAAKGLRRLLVAEGMDAERLHVHVSEVGPGERSHQPHTHGGAEAIYVLEGTVTVEVEDTAYRLGPNECILIDPTHRHGLLNAGTVRIRYLVMITP